MLTEGCQEYFKQEIDEELYKITKRVNYGIQLRNEGNYEKALQIFKTELEASEILCSPDSPSIAPLLKSIMITYFEQCEYQLATEYGNQALLCWNNSKSKNDDIYEQKAMIYDFKFQAEIKMCQISDAIVSLHNAINCMEKAHIPKNDPKYMEMIFVAEMYTNQSTQSTQSLQHLNNTMNIANVDGVDIIQQIIGVWCRVDTKVHGCLKIKSPNCAFIKNPQFGFANKMSSFETMCKESPEYTNSTQLLSELRSWYTRMKLRYSCSSLTTITTTAIIPKLISAGITSITLNKKHETIQVQLRNIEVYTIVYQPNTNHGIEYLSKKKIITENIEIPSIQKPTHQILYSQVDDCVIDLSGGQFTGIMYSSIMFSKNDYIDTFPGTISVFEKASQQDIMGQVYRDENLGSLFPTYHPNSIAEQVVQNVLDPKIIICKVCLGTPKVPLRCTRCHHATYCGKHCQKYDWKTHKHQCST